MREENAMYVAIAINAGAPVIPQLCAGTLEELKELVVYYEENIAHKLFRWKISGPEEYEF